MLAVRDVSVSGYRSLRRISVPVDDLSVFVGGNGTGKTNLYRALELLQAAARGTLTRDLAAEGGMDSALWAPPELSDGTLLYLALAGALLGYRLPPFIALNEPETSRHPGLMDPLARLIAWAARRMQVWLVTHSERLSAGIAEHGGIRRYVVVKRDGDTWIDGLTLTGAFEEE